MGIVVRCFLYPFYIKPQPMLVDHLIINDIYRKYHFKNKGSGLKICQRSKKVPIALDRQEALISVLVLYVHPYSL